MMLMLKHLSRFSIHLRKVSRGLRGWIALHEAALKEAESTYSQCWRMLWSQQATSKELKVRASKFSSWSKANVRSSGRWWNIALWEQGKNTSSHRWVLFSLKKGQRETLQGGVISTFTKNPTNGYLIHSIFITATFQTCVRKVSQGRGLDWGESTDVMDCQQNTTFSAQEVS